MNMQAKRGRFLISGVMLYTDFKAVQRVFSLCVPVRAEHLYDRDEIEFTAIGKPFREVEQGYQTPWYNVEFERNGRKLTVRFVERKEPTDA